MLRELIDQNALPPGSRARAHWALASTFTAGSESTVPFHTLNDVARELRHPAHRPPVEDPGSADAEAVPVVP